MELKVNIIMASIGLKIIVLAACISVTLTQTVTVNMRPEIESNPQTASAKLTCHFSVDDDMYVFSNLEWRIDGSFVADFFGGAMMPDYQNYCLSPGNCNITRSDTQSDFVISSLDYMTNNNDQFSCQVTFSKLPEIIDGQDSAVLKVVVPINTNMMVMLNGSSLDPFTNGSKVELSLGVNSHIFQCQVAAINPQATFTWTVGGNQLPSDSITEEDPVVDIGTGLTTSTSNAALKPDRRYNGLVLICEAKNYEGDPGVTFSLLLKVADPCDVVMCMNGGTCVIDTNDPSMTMCECPVGYEGELCAKAITTTVGPPSTPTPTGTTEVTPTPGPGLQLWIIAVIVIVVVLIAVGVLVCCLVQRKCCCFS